MAVTGYRVERCQGAGCTTFAEIAAPSGTGTTYNDTTVVANSTYRYRVRATDAAPNLGPYSPIATATTPTAADTTPPTAPASLTATAVGPTQVNLSWSAATDNVAVTGYRVERCQGAGCTTFAEIAAPSGTGTTYNDTTVVANSTYRYRVRATDAAPNLGPYSPIATATTPAAADTTPPTAPASLTATAVGPTQVNLSWSAATDNVAVTGYRVERCQGAGLHHLRRDRRPQRHRHHVQRHGRRRHQHLPLPRPRHRRRPQPRPLLADRDRDHPGGRRHDPADGAGEPDRDRGRPTQVDLSWSAATDNVAVTGYRLERCQGAGCTTFAEIATPTGRTTFNDTGRRRDAPTATGSAPPTPPATSAPTAGSRPRPRRTTAAPAGLVAAYSFNEGRHDGRRRLGHWKRRDDRDGDLVDAGQVRQRAQLQRHQLPASPFPMLPSLRLTSAMTLEAWVLPNRRLEQLAGRDLQGRRQLLPHGNQC